MDLPKCRTCGERHRLGPCPSSQTKSRGGGESGPAGPNGGTPERQGKLSPHVGKVARPEITNGRAEKRTEAGVAPSPRDTDPVAKATKGKTGTAVVTGHVRGSPTGTGLRVGEAIAVQPATSEIMDATAGETAPKFDRLAYQREYMKGWRRRRAEGKTK